MKMVQLREGIYANGGPRREGDPRSQIFHVVDASADLHGTEEVTSPCGIGFAPGALEVVEWNYHKAHDLCRRRACLQGKCGWVTSV
jgi:hypothetical protein